MDETTASDPLEQVAALVQQGLVARLWFFPVTAEGHLRRAVRQIDGIPITPDAAASGVLRSLLERARHGDPEVVAVIERHGASRPNPDDWAWHDAIHRAARSVPVVLRGVLLAHAGGVDALEPRTLAA
ncbi:hypothetical protein [Agrococcus sp. Ld7]|uniref:hypothetical protein n=1 Tax=Agrococcus sp. Ld7 TaxID=649148 RepID=UPI00386B6ECC